MTKEQTNSWEEELKEIIDGDWELMELNPGRPYRTGMKEVHFIKLKVFISQEREKWIEEIKKLKTHLTTICQHCGAIESYDNEDGKCRECWENMCDEEKDTRGIEIETISLEETLNLLQK